jgi:hypothetical protein
MITYRLDALILTNEQVLTAQENALLRLCERPALIYIDQGFTGPTASTSPHIGQRFGQFGLQAPLQGWP